MRWAWMVLVWGISLVAHAGPEWETGRDNPAYSVRHGDIVRYLPGFAGRARALVGRLDDTDGTPCWVFHHEDGSPWSGKVTWTRDAVVACAKGDEHLGLVAAVPVPGEVTEQLAPLFGPTGEPVAVESPTREDLEEAAVVGGRLVVGARRWTLHGGALVLPRDASPEGPVLRPPDGGDGSLANEGSAPVDIAGLVVRGPWACYGCFSDAHPDVVLHVGIAPGPDGTRILGPREELPFSDHAIWGGAHAWFQDEGARSLWAGDSQVFP